MPTTLDTGTRDVAAELLALIDASPIALCHITQRRFSMVSHAMKEITGYDAATLVGSSTRLLFFSDEEYEASWNIVQNQVSSRGNSGWRYAAADATVRRYGPAYPANRSIMPIRKRKSASLPRTSRSSTG